MVSVMLIRQGNSNRRKNGRQQGKIDTRGLKQEKQWSLHRGTTGADCHRHMLEQLHWWRCCSHQEETRHSVNMREEIRARSLAVQSTRADRSLKAHVGWRKQRLGRSESSSSSGCEQHASCRDMPCHPGRQASGMLVFN